MSKYKATDKYAFMPGTNERLMIKIEGDSKLINEAGQHLKKDSKNSTLEIIKGSELTLLDATTGKEYLLALTQETERPNPNYAETLISITPQILVLDGGKVAGVQHDGFGALGIKKSYLPQVDSKVLYTSRGSYTGIDPADYAKSLSVESIAIATQDKRMAIANLASIVKEKMPDVRYKLRGHEVQSQAVAVRLDDIKQGYDNDPKSMPADKARELFLLAFKPESFSTNFGVIQSPEDAATRYNGGYLSVSEPGRFIEIGDVERKLLIGKPSESDAAILKQLAGDDMLVDAKAVKIKESKNHVLVYTVVDKDEKAWVRGAHILESEQISQESSNDALKAVGINPNAFKQGETYYTAAAINPPRAGNKLTVKNASLLSQTSPNELRKNISLEQLQDHKIAGGIEVFDRYAQRHADSANTQEAVSFKEVAKDQLKILRVDESNQDVVEMLYRHHMTPEFNFLHDELDVHGSVLIENPSKVEIDGNKVVASLVTTSRYRTKPDGEQKDHLDWGIMHFSENGQMVLAENQNTNPLIKDAYSIEMPDNAMEDGGMNGFRVREFIGRNPESYGINPSVSPVPDETKRIDVSATYENKSNINIGLGNKEDSDKPQARKNKI